MKLTQEIANNYCDDVSEHFLQGKTNIGSNVFNRYFNHCIQMLRLAGYRIGNEDYEEQAMIENAADSAWQDHKEYVNETKNR